MAGFGGGAADISSTVPLGTENITAAISDDTAARMRAARR
jgi:hypothetical protein